MEGKAMFLVVSAVLLGFSLGNPFVPFAGGWNAVQGQGRTNKEGCCVPDQFETYCVGLMSGDGQPGELLQESLYFSYDAKGQRVSCTGSTYGPSGLLPLRFIQLFKQKKMYFINSDGSCVVKPLTATFGKFCVKDNPTYMGRLVAGSGSNVVQTDVWQRMRKNYYETMAVTPGDCVIVGESSFGQAGSNPVTIPMLGAVGYANTTLGIQSPDVFTPPKVCKAAADNNELPPGLMKYIANKFIDQNETKFIF